MSSVRLGARYAAKAAVKVQTTEHKRDGLDLVDTVEGVLFKSQSVFKVTA